MCNITKIYSVYHDMLIEKGVTLGHANSTVVIYRVDNTLVYYSAIRFSIYSALWSRPYGPVCYFLMKLTIAGINVTELGSYRKALVAMSWDRRATKPK